MLLEGLFVGSFLAFFEELGGVRPRPFIEFSAPASDGDWNPFPSLPPQGSFLVRPVVTTACPLHFLSYLARRGRFLPSPLL